MTPLASEPDRRRLAQIVNRARWASIALGLVEAVISRPPPISRFAMILGLLVAALYNAVAQWRLPALGRTALERFLWLLLIADFLVLSNSVAFTANAPIDDGYLLYVMVAVEATLVFQLRGAAVFQGAFMVAFGLWLVERAHYFQVASQLDSYLFGAGTMAVVTFFCGAMTRLAAQSARSAREETARATASQTSLTAVVDMIVHDLRSPLTVIGGYAELLAADADVREQPHWNHALDAIQSKVAEMRESMEEMLLAARVQAEVNRRAPVHCHAHELVAAAVERARVRAALLGGSVECGDGDAGMAVDPRGVARILDNLINNALNYGGDPPVVRVSVVTDDPVVRIVVADGGPGIPADIRESMFNRFVRGAGTAARTGSGLGLWVARELARVQSGDVVLLHSGHGDGTAFELRLPLDSAAMAG